MSLRYPFAGTRFNGLPFFPFSSSGFVRGQIDFGQNWRKVYACHGSNRAEYAEHIAAAF